MLARKPLTIALVLFATICASLTNATAFAQTADSPIRPYRSTGIVDATTLENGKKLLLFRHAATDKDESPETQRDDVAENYIRMFNHPTDPNARLGIAWLDRDKKNGMGIYLFKDGKTEFQTYIGERIRSPTFYQSESGDIFVGSRGGVIYWVKPDGSLLRYQVPWPAGSEPNPVKTFRTIEFTSFPGSNIVCAWSIANPKYHPRALYNIAVADPEKGWRTVDLAGRVTGPVAMTSTSELKMLQYDRWLNIDINSGEVTETPFEVPREGDTKTTPLSVTRLPDGKLISIWRKNYRSYKPNDIDPYENGFYKRICEWDPENESDGWKIVAGKDRIVSKKITQITDAGGGWWTATAEGTLLYRSRAGEYRELDYRSGIATDGIDRLRVDGENSFWIFGRAAIEVDASKILATKPVNSREWREVYSRSILGLSAYAPNRTASPIVTPDDKVICISDLDREYDFPSEDILPLGDKRSVMAYEDKHGRPWLVSNGDDKQWHVAGFVDGAWKKHDVKRTPGLKWDEAVAQWFSQQDLVRTYDFLGRRISFGPGGRIAYLNRTASLFDGQKWHKSKLETETTDSGRKRARTVQFTKDSVRLWYSKYLAYDLPYHLWKDLNPETVRPWKPVQEPLGLPVNFRERRARTNEFIRNAPLYEKESAWVFNDEYRFAYFSPSHVSLYDGQHWTTVPSTLSPFSARRSISSIGRYYDGSWVFMLNSSGNSRRFVIYRPTFAKLEVAEKAIGIQADAAASLQPKWNCDKAIPGVRLRFKIGNGEWFDWQPADQPVFPGVVIPGGQHQMFVQLHCPVQMLPNDPLEYTFEVGYDMSDKIEHLVDQLSAVNFQARQDAEKELSQMGPHVIEWLTERYESAKDPETRAAVGRVLNELKKPKAKKK